VTATVTATVTAEPPAKAATVATQRSAAMAAASAAYQKECHNAADQQNQQPVVGNPLHLVFPMGRPLLGRSRHASVSGQHHEDAGRAKTFRRRRR
jgi:hypothetical protein